MQTRTPDTRVAIRPFTALDYVAVAQIFNASFAEFSMTAAEWRLEDEQRPAYCRWARWVAEYGSRVVGFAHYEQHAGHYHPRKFQLTVAIDPAFYGRGIGGRLFDLVLQEIEAFDPLSADEWSREDMSVRRNFLERRGFVEDMRMWTSSLDFAEFDARRFAETIESVEAQGIRIRSLAELGASDQTVQQKLYELWLAVRHDIPSPPDDVRSDVSFEEWWGRNNRPTLLPAGYLVAIVGQQYVGTSQLWLSADPAELRTGTTAVLRAHRRRGIALALKVRALEFGQAQGYHRAVTENEVNNRGMIAINDQLGFVKNPVWLHYLKSFPR
jgi:mycothiol synthase